MIKRILSEFAVIFLVVLLSINSIAIVLMIDQIKSLNDTVSSMNDRISQYEINSFREETLSEAKIIEFYREINDKTNESINRILTIVSLIAGVVTFFSLLLAYKAPHDIDKRIDELGDLISDTKSSADEAKYQALISSAMAKPTSYDVIKKLRGVIRKYPDKPDAYVVRGFMYDDIKKYDSAISDYEIAKKYGCELEIYYNSMGVAYSNKKEHNKAIDFFSKAIKIDPNDSSYYCNRACSYDDIDEFEKALADYSKAIEIDSECFEAYYNRNFTYDQLWRIEENADKKMEYIFKRKSDLEEAVKLNPQSDDALKLLKRFTSELIDQGIILSKEEMIERNIAIIDEKIADISNKDGNYKYAFEHYLDALEFYIKQVMIEKKEAYMSDIERLEDKIIEIIIIDNAQGNISVGEKPNIFLVADIATKAYDFYINGEKPQAEILFRFILPLSCSALNLAFMKRRNETLITNESPKDLLELEEDKRSAIWCINMALCLIDEAENDNDWINAIEILKNSTTDIESAIDFWSNIDLVGTKENNMVFLLLTCAGLWKDDNKLEIRIEMARNDGYAVPVELVQNYV